MAESNGAIKVLLTTEGTYPYHSGGVGTWCDILVGRMPEVAFTVYSVATNPFIMPRYRRHPNMTDLLSVPLWGTEEPSEHITSIPFADVYRGKRRTGKGAVKVRFIPIFEAFIHGLLGGGTDTLEMGGILFSMHRYFQAYDYRSTMKSVQVWDAYLAAVRCHVAEGRLTEPTVYEAVEAMGWLFRFLTILNTPVPTVDLTHSTAAAFCGLPCVLSKIKDGTPFLLTEHGVYLREQYLAAGRSGMSPFAHAFYLKLVSLVSRLSYAYADMICPVCGFNIRWETRFGVEPERVRIIYNGVDPDTFRPGPSRPRETPTVVSVMRIDPLKDVETLLRTADVVRRSIPGVRFLVHGEASDPAYEAGCRRLANELSLNDTVVFKGFTANPAQAYAEGDIVLVTSVSEGFPYTVIEAMMSGKAVVSTDVGGIREALGGVGMLANPRDHEALGAACVALLSDPVARAEMEDEAFGRALANFTTDKFISGYRRAYRELVQGARARAEAAATGGVNANA